MPELYFNQFDLHFNFRLIDQDFIILKFSRDKWRLSYHDLALMDGLLTQPENRALSVCFDWGKDAFALYDRRKFGGSPQAIIQEMEIEDALRVEPTSARQVWKNKLFQLFLNACSGAEHPRYRYNNLTGRLFITSPDNAFYNAKDKSRVALEVKVMQDMIIKLDTITLTSLARYQDLIKDEYGKVSPKMQKKVKDLEKYVFDPRHSTFRRYFEDETVSTADKYVRMRPPQHLIRGKKKKNLIDFLSLNPKKYPHTKIALFNELLFDVFQSRFGQYINFAQKKVTQGVTSRKLTPVDESFAGLQDVPVRLIDHVRDENAIAEIRDLLQSADVKYRMTKKTKAGSLNLQFNHDQEYYQLEKTLKDPYEKATLDCAVQNLTLQQFRENKQNQLYKALQEGHIKYDISQQQLTIFDWKALQMDRDWYFAIAEQEEEELTFHFLVISPTGALTFSTFTRDLFNQSFHELMAGVFTGANSYKVKATDGVIFDGNGNLNVIEQTDLRTYPDLSEVHHYIMRGVELEGVTRPVSVLKDFVDSFINQNGASDQIETLRQYLAAKSDSEDVLLTEIRELLKGKTKINILFARQFKDRFDHWLKYPFKNKEQVDKTFAALVDIHQIKEGKDILFWANKDMGKSKGEFTKTNVVRRLKPYGDSTLLFDQLLNTMAVDFVRVDAPSVIPFPFKLLREYQKMAEKPELDLDLSGFDFIQ